MQISLQSKSLWLENVSMQNLPSSEQVNLLSGDGVSASIPVSFLVASSDFLQLLLLPYCFNCSDSNTIYLPTVTGFTLKLLSQILLGGETEQLPGDGIVSCLESVEEVLELLGCEVKLVTKLSRTRAIGHFQVANFESLGHETALVNEELDNINVCVKEELEVFEDFDNYLEVKEEASVDRHNDCNQEDMSFPLPSTSDLQQTYDLRNCFVKLRTLKDMKNVKCDLNRNVLTQDLSHKNESAPEVFESIRNSNPNTRDSSTRKDLPKSPNGVMTSKKVKQCSVCQLYFGSRKLFIEHCKTAHNIQFKSKTQRFLKMAPTASQDTPSHSIRSNPIQHVGLKQEQGRSKNSIRREFQCSQCDLGFFTAAGLEMHTSDKHGVNYHHKDFKCFECNLSYYTQKSLDKHKHEKHGNVCSKDQVNTFTPLQLCDYFQGPFSCTYDLCNYTCDSPTMFGKHWNQKHTNDASKASFVDKSTSTMVTLYQVYTFILQCRLCGIVRCSRDVMNKAVGGMSQHLNNHHPNEISTQKLSNMYSVLQDQNGRKMEPVFDSIGDFSEDKNPTIVDMEKVPTIAEFTPERSNTSFSQKGYYGSYHCLKEGCSYVCEKFGKITQKLLVNHWSMEHGDVRPLLYLDKSSFTILNLKIICNNVGYCSYDGCNHIMYASRKADFPSSVLNHWKNSHPNPDNSYNPSMCNVISGKQVPIIIEDKAVALVRKLHIKGEESVRQGESLVRKFHIQADGSVSQGESHEEVGGLLTCSIPGCGENGVSIYGRHFLSKHKDLPLDNIRVTTEEGKLLSCQDVLNFALKCDLCTFVTVSGLTNKKYIRRSTKKHWLSDHKDKNIEEMSFSDIMPMYSDKGKELDSNTTSSSDKEQKTLQIEPEDYLANVADDYLYDDVVIDETSSVDAEVTFEERQADVYKCGVIGCQKMVVVSRFSTALVALNRLKSHFTKKHRDLQIEDFKYETKFKHYLDNAVSVVVKDVPTPTTHPPKTETATIDEVEISFPSLSCFKCGAKKRNRNELYLHFSLQHLSLKLIDDYGIQKKCSIEGCGKTFESFYSCVSHLSLKHPSVVEEYIPKQYRLNDFKCPLQCSTSFTEQNELFDHFRLVHRFNSETVKKIIKAHPQLNSVIKMV